MNRRIKTNTAEPRLLSTIEMADYLGLGRNRTIKFGDEAGARVQIGRRVLWDKRKIDLYIDSMGGRQ